MKYKPYDAYKDSGVEWIGDIPQGWEVKKLRFLGDLDSSGVDKKIRDDEKQYKSVHLWMYTEIGFHKLGTVMII